MIVDSQILRDVVITELEKYRDLLIELGREGYEKVDELIDILEEEDGNKNIETGTKDT